MSADRAAYAVYFAGYTEGHSPQIGTLVISLGDWSSKGTPGDRVAMLLRVRTVNREFEMMIGGPRDCPWHDLQVLGHLMSRDEALAHPQKDEFFHVADHIVAEDERFTRYFTS